VTTTPSPLRTQGAAAHPHVEGDGTRRRVLELVATEGPVTAGRLAEVLGLTQAAVRRHLAGLEHDGTIMVHDGGHGTGRARRGRPARHYVVSTAGQAELGDHDSELATQAMRFLRRTGGDEAVEAFATERNDAVVRRYAPRLTATDPRERAAQLADLLAADGYASSVRPVVGPLVTTVQLCQGHCPVQHAAEDFPELCEAEARAFSELLGTHVQRLATLAGGAHACVTNIPLTPPTPAGRSGGTQEGSR
jgi:predicted ArsR family transcriptional regulator